METASPFRCFATCARGLESVLADELIAIGASDVSEGRGGSSFSGDLGTIYKANLCLRTAFRVLRLIFESTVTSPEELYEAVQTIDWAEYMTPDHTLAVDCNVRDSALTHSKYAALKTKDAICDWFVERQGSRPSVDVNEPMVGLNLHVYRNQAVLSLDSSGMSLHKRGYRTVLHKAALNEALAAGLLMLSGWDRESPLVDPLCGSGTFLIEGAWLALNRPPGLTRKRFGFQGWLDFDRGLWNAIRDEARDGIEGGLGSTILGTDNRKDVLSLARSNAKAAGCGHALTFQKRELADFEPPIDTPGLLICNPPYGERIGDEKQLRGLYRLLGTVLKERFQGWRAVIFTANNNLARQIGLTPSERIALYNGKISCQLLQYDLE
ncbi:MAG: class I SAM-dependent RNA methyltransferase [Gemmataceae bacterium]